LCAPKGAAFLWVRADRRAAVHPTVISHGANNPRTDRSRYVLEFDWVGTMDPTPALSLPAAIDWMGALEPGGWPAVMAANHALALAGRDTVAATLGVARSAPDAMLGSMAALPLAGIATDAEADTLGDALFHEDRIEVPLPRWPVRGARSAPTADPRAVLVRISAQRYNEPADYERLADSLARRLQR
jgi:isopenicillin-N epimerase